MLERLAIKGQQRAQGTVLHVEPVTLHMRRITLDGAEVAAFVQGENVYSQLLTALNPFNGFTLRATFSH